MQHAKLSRVKLLSFAFIILLISFLLFPVKKINALSPGRCIIDPVYEHTSWDLYNKVASQISGYFNSVDDQMIMGVTSKTQAEIVFLLVADKAVTGNNLAITDLENGKFSVTGQYRRYNLNANGDITYQGNGSGAISLDCMNFSYNTGPLGRQTVLNTFDKDQAIADESFWADLPMVGDVAPPTEPTGPVAFSERDAQIIAFILTCAIFYLILRNFAVRFPR